jgi:hypothetical protein
VARLIGRGIDMGKKAVVHVNQHEIKKNNKDGGDRPVITVKTYNTNEYASEVSINGPSKVIYSPSKPLSCGARVWIEADYDDIELI